MTVQNIMGMDTRNIDLLKPLWNTDKNGILIADETNNRQRNIHAYVRTGRHNIRPLPHPGTIGPRRDLGCLYRS